MSFLGQVRAESRRTGVPSNMGIATEPLGSSSGSVSMDLINFQNMLVSSYVERYTFFLMKNLGNCNILDVYPDFGLISCT